MNVIKECGCGANFTEQGFVPPVGRAEKFGLPSGTFGNTQATFIRIKCVECGRVYVAEVKPGKRGGTIKMGRVMDVSIGEQAPIPAPAPAPIKKAPAKAVQKPAEKDKMSALKASLAKAAAEVKDGYIDIPDA